VIFDTKKQFPGRTYCDTLRGVFDLKRENRFTFFIKTKNLVVPGYKNPVIAASGDSSKFGSIRLYLGGFVVAKVFRKFEIS